MSKEGEPALQFDLFSGELVDNRTPKQKRIAKEQERPQQTMMFSQRDLAQFGVNPRPLLPISSRIRLELMIEDRRSEEEIEAANQAEALKENYRLFEEENPMSDVKEEGREKEY